MTAASQRRLGAIVLAGGRSARFGRDKLAEPLGGRSLLMHAIEAVTAVDTGLDLVVVAAPGASPTIPAGARLVHDPRAFEGPLAGVATGLAALGPDTDRVVVVGGDMPGLVPAVLRLLASSLDDDPAVDLALLAGDDRARPLPSAIRRAAGLRAADALLVAGERRLRALADVLVTAVLPASAWRPLDPSGTTLGDVDTPDDLPAP
jgi:molybdopterin-guanine dinucleotide biosynthesis protein A